MTLDQWGYICGMVGTVGITLPAIKATRTAKFLHKSRKRLGLAANPDLEKLRQEHVREIEQSFNKWNARDAIYLLGGLFLTFVSYVLPLLATLHTPGASS